MNGVLIVDKEAGYTSRDVVNVIGKILMTKKIGHTGTLDPMATGVLVLCVGSATKLVEILTCDDKEYIAEVTLGIRTDTLDSTGTILEEKVVNVTKEEVKESLKKLCGHYDQEVPIYSAVKINGKKLYEYARQNKEVILPKRDVEIKELELISDIEYKDDKVIFIIKCVVSKGTYIRSLVTDIASSLNTIGVMSSLRRTRQGHFNLNDSYQIKDIENNNYQLLKIKDCLKDLYTVTAKEELLFKIRNGALIENIYPQEVVYFIDDLGEPLAIYHKYGKDNSKLKPWKMF